MLEPVHSIKRFMLGMLVGPPVTTLDYMNKFACLGADCESTCCTGWQVEVSQQDLKRLQETVTQDSEFAPLGERIEIFEDDKKNSVGFLKISQNKSCTFLDSSGLCSLHRVHGKEALPSICSTYPRNIHRIGGNIELSGQLSCPEVARLLLLGKDSVKRVAAEEITFRLPENSVETRYMGYLNALRSMALWLLERQFPIESRLHFLLELAQRTQPFIYSGMEEDLPTYLIESVRPLLDDQYLHRTHVQVQGLHSKGLKGLRIIMELMQECSRSAKRKGNCFKELVEDILPPEKPLIEAQNELLKMHVYRRMIMQKCLGERIDRYSTRIAINYWFGNLFTASSDPMIYMQRLLMLNGVCRTLWIHHSSVRNAVTEFEKDGDLEKLESTVDQLAVKFTYNTFRAVEHSSRFNKIQEAIEDDDGQLTQYLCMI